MRTRRELAAAVWPLALRSLRRQRGRYALMSGLLGLGIATYLLYATYLSGAGLQASLALAPFELPADVVFLGQRTLAAAELGEWERRGGVDVLAVARLTEYRTEHGTLRVLALPAASPLWEAVGAPAPEPGAILLPALFRPRAGPTISLIPPRAPEGAAPAVVAGHHTATDVVLSSMALTLLPQPGPAPNCLFIWARTEAAAASLAGTLTVDYLQPRRPLLSRADGPVLLWTGTAAALARGVVSQTYMPGAGALTMVLAFCGIGLFTVSSLSFLDRKRDLAILKTVGLESGGITAMLLLEQGFVAAAGTALAMAVAAATIPPLRGLLPAGSGLRWTSVFWGVAVGMLVQAAGVALPVLTARVATVNQLLLNLPVSLQRRRVYGNRE